MILLLATAIAPSARAENGPPSTSELSSLLARYPVGTVVGSDPMGTYVFTYVTPRVYSVNLTEYQKILGDPFQKLIGSIALHGPVVLITVPATNVTAGYVTYYDAAWAGDSSGFCQAIDFSGINGDPYCYNPSSSIYENQVWTSNTLGWTTTCTGGDTTCFSAFWRGLSQDDPKTGTLVQNGVQCSYGSAGLACIAFFEQYSSNSGCSEGEQSYPSQPTNFNGVTYAADTQVTSSNIANFYDYVGSWNYATSENLKCSVQASSFVLGEGIIETPTVYGNRVANYVEWSPNSVQLGGAICTPSPSCRGYGAGPYLIYYNRSPYFPYNIQAYGSTTDSSGNYYTITYTGSG